MVATNQFAEPRSLRVADLNHMQAVVDVNENDVVKVKIGDKARVTIDAYSERKFNGTVQQIANTGKTTGTGTQEEVTNFEVKIQIADQDVRLRPGLSCTADIQTDMVKMWSPCRCKRDDPDGRHHMSPPRKWKKISRKRRLVKRR